MADVDIPVDLAQTLLAVVDAGSMDGAARALRLTPSAVSQRIKTLEQRLGRVLLVRSKPARVTEAGGVVLRLARQSILLEYDALAELGGDPAQSTSVALAVNADSLSTWILPALARAAESRAVVFDIHREDQDHTAALLESGEVMAAVTSRRAPVAGCTSSYLGAMRYRAVASPTFLTRWMPDGNDVDRAALAPVVYFDLRDDLQQRALAALGVSSTPPRHFVPSSQDFAAAVRLGLGWGMLPDAQCDEELAAGTLVELSPPTTVLIPLYWQQWNLQSHLLGEVADAVAAEAATALAR